MDQLFDPNMDVDLECHVLFWGMQDSNYNVYYFDSIYFASEAQSILATVVVEVGVITELKMGAIYLPRMFAEVSAIVEHVR